MKTKPEYFISPPIKKHVSCNAINYYLFKMYAFLSHSKINQEKKLLLRHTLKILFICTNFFCKKVSSNLALKFFLRYLRYKCEMREVA
jgi:hypothetical protein